MPTTTVYVVVPEEAEPAVFEREQDADSFAATYTDDQGACLFAPEVYRLTVADAETAAQMIRDRQED